MSEPLIINPYQTNQDAQIMSQQQYDLLTLPCPHSSKLDQRDCPRCAMNSGGVTRLQKARLDALCQIEVGKMWMERSEKKINSWFKSGNTEDTTKIDCNSDSELIQ